jgi:hypothetical protein
MSDLKFVEGDDDFCDAWESEAGIILVPPKGFTDLYYDVYTGMRPINECENHCKKDTPNSMWCMCGPELPVKCCKTLKSAKAFLRKQANRGDTQ